MSTTVYGVNDPEAVKLWSRMTLSEALKSTYFGRFIGENSDALCQIKDDTSKSSGDRVRTILRMQLNGDGVAGDGTQEGLEESLVTYTDDLLINQLRHATRVGGRATEQRVPFEIREESRLALQDWWSNRLDTWFFNQIGGNSGQTDTKYTGMNTATAPDSTHRIFANGHTTEVSLTATASAQFTLSLIDQAKLLAVTLSPMIRPIKGKYVMFLTPEQHFDLRRNTNTLEWGDIQKAAMQGGKVADNPIFTGALGEYNGIVLHEAFRLPVITSTGSSKIGRAVLCGAQAACMAFGRGYSKNRMEWVEELFDYKNQFGVAAGVIAGLKKNIYNSKDFATITVSAAHSASAVAASGR